MKGDTLPGKLATARGRVSEPFLRAIEWALALDEKLRPQSIPDWRRALQGQVAAPATTRSAPQSAPMVVPAQPLPKTQLAPAARRSAPQPPEKSGSGWRWVGIAAVLLVAVLAVSAWNKQRSAQTAARGDSPAPEVKAPKPRPKPAVAEQPSADTRDTLRARPERERADRPGDTQRPALEEFRKKIAQEFKSADRDGDGYLSRAEVQGRFPGIEREYGRVDADGDGRISPEEFLRIRRFQAQQKLKKQ
jgi:hypothetical protein